MSKKGGKKGYYMTPSKPKKDDKYAYGKQCVYCGKELIGTPKYYAKAHTREFPVCSEECKKATEAYVQNDKTKKLFFYLSLTVCAIMILVGALMGENPLIIYPGMMIAGLGLLIFPYPITSFETFFQNSIRRVTRLTRVTGVVFLLAGIFFLVTSLV